MTAAAGLAGLAGVLAAVGVADLVAARRPRRPRRAGWRVVGVALLRRLGRGVGPRAGPRDLEARLAASGLALPVGDFLAVKGGAALATLLAVLPAAPGLPGRLPIVVPLALPAAAFLVPDAWLRRRIRARVAAMERELPDVLDLIRVAVGAGLPANRALAQVGLRHPGLLAAELRHATRALELGVPTAAAYAQLARRAPLPGVAVLVGALGRAGRHGAPLDGALAAQAAEARSARARETAERAARAAPKIQLVVALLLVPSVLLLVAAALIPAVLGA